jgi:outer membrane protein OmpA-like peptidoglycan-associated protein
LSRSRTILLGILGLAILIVLAIVMHGDLDGDLPAKPVRLRLVATRPAGDITLAGQVRDTETRRLIAGLARRAFGHVIDRLEVEPRTERIGWTAQLGPTFKALAAAGVGASIDRANDTVIVAAIVPNNGVKQRLLRTVRTSVGSGAAIVDQIAVRGAPPARPSPKPPGSAAASAAKVAKTQAALDAALRRGTIEFETGSAVITGRGLAVLQSVVPILRRAQGLTVEVAGYTDASGAASDNRRLSRQRAEAVRRWLIGRGIAADRLTAHGYGAADPVASNDTAEGRARNRRIEMHVKEA